jgi:serine/threonine protein kinase
VIDELGSGSNATVYLSSCIETQRKVAVKALNLESQFELDPTSQILKNELESHWALAECEGILKLLEVFMGNNTLYIILEYQEHGTLHSLME